MPAHRLRREGSAEPLSAHNPRLTALAALTRKRSERAAVKRFVLEGPVAVDDALRRGAQVHEVYLGIDDGEVEGFASLAARAGAVGAAVYLVEPRRLARCLTTVAPRPVAAVAAMPVAASDVLATSEALLVLAGVAEPGNLGTLVRTAEAAGFGAVLCCDGAVDPFNPKAVRASAGAICTLPVITGKESVHVLEELGELGYRRIATRADAADSYLDADLAGRVAVVLGNEAHGVPRALDALVDLQVRIPMAGAAESLNVAAAGAVLCFEVARQRIGAAR